MDFIPSASSSVSERVNWPQLAEEAFQFDELRSARMLVDHGMRSDDSAGFQAELLQMRKKIEDRQNFFNSQVEDILQDANKAIADGSVQRARQLVEKALLIRQATNLEVAKQTNDFIAAMSGGSVSTGRPLSNDTDAMDSNPDWADVAEEMRPGVLKILVCDHRGPVGEGTGFAVASNLLVTNSHVVRSKSGTLAKHVFVINAEKELVPIHGLLHEEEQKDIAVLLSQKSWTRECRLELSQANPLYQKNNRQGDMVAAFGHPVGLNFSFSTGHISAVRTAQEMRVVKTGDRRPHQGIWFQHTAPISPGNSGGPLINRNGKILAMNTLGSNGTVQNLNFSISAKDIQDAIEIANTKDADPFDEPSRDLARMVERKFLSH